MECRNLFHSYQSCLHYSSELHHLNSNFQIPTQVSLCCFYCGAYRNTHSKRTPFATGQTISTRHYYHKARKLPEVRPLSNLADLFRFLQTSKRYLHTPTEPCRPFKGVRGPLQISPHLYRLLLSFTRCLKTSTDASRHLKDTGDPCTHIQRSTDTYRLVRPLKGAYRPL